MAAPGMLDAEAEGRRLEAADQPVDDSDDVWTDHFGPPQSLPQSEVPQSPHQSSGLIPQSGGRRLRPQCTSAIDPVGTHARRRWTPIDCAIKANNHRCSGWAINARWTITATWHQHWHQRNGWRTPT